MTEDFGDNLVVRQSTMQPIWTWFQSDASLALRIAAGLCIFATLAIVDYRRHGPRATRWREYTFLLACVLLAIAYGIVNDLITSRISVEYFLYGKGVADRVSDEVAAHPELHRGRLDIEAIRIGTLATWSAGLIAGALLLFANSLGRRRPPLPLGTLARLVWPIFVCAAACAIVGGWLGGHGAMTRFNSDFAEMVAADQWRPYRFMCVFGIHLGGYVGAGVGLAAAIARVLSLRRRCLATEA